MTPNKSDSGELRSKLAELFSHDDDDGNTCASNYSQCKKCKKKYKLYISTCQKSPCGHPLTYYETLDCNCYVQDYLDEAMAAISSHMQAVGEEIIGQVIKFEWKLYDEVYPYSGDKSEEFINEMTFLVCTICGHQKDDPEVGHKCEADNNRNKEQRQRLAQYLGKTL